MIPATHTVKIWNHHFTSYLLYNSLRATCQSAWAIMVYCWVGFC